MIRLVSYSYPPDNVPAAHRPFQLVRSLTGAGLPHRIYTRKDGALFAENGRPTVSEGRSRRLADNRVVKVLTGSLRLFVEPDKALFWGLFVFPRVWAGLMGDWLREKRRPDVWATAPLMTNLYVAGMAAILSGSRLHIDLRDLIRGLDGQRMPVLTSLVLRYARTITVVSKSIGRLAAQRAPYLPPAAVVYNGIAIDDFDISNVWTPRSKGWLQVLYAGAVYGGARPYASALAALRSAAEVLGEEWRGIELIFIGRENVSPIVSEFQTRRFRIIAKGPVAKIDAVRMAAGSDVNMVLVGSGDAHRYAIPLKVFDLLGVGRPIFYHGPANADASSLLASATEGAYFLLDSESSARPNEHALAGWLIQSACTSTKPVDEPSAASEVRKILEMIYTPRGSEGRASKNTSVRRS